MLSPQILTQTRTATISTVFPVTSGMNLLLRAQDLALSDGASVSTWADTSGSGNDLTQATGANQPVYASSGVFDSKPYVAFVTETARYMSNTSYSVSKQAQSFFVVLDLTSLYTSKYIVLFGSGLTLLYMNDAAVFKRFDGGTTSTSLTHPPTGKRIGIVVTLGATGNKIYIDSSTNVASLSAEASGTITGIQISQSAAPLRAKVFEARSWNRELSSGEVSSILDTWAPAVYGTGAAAATPSGRVICDGDSITEGLNSGKALSWPFYLNPSNGWVAHNYAVQGQTWANLISRQATTNTFANSTNWLIVNAGTNDISNSRTATQIETDFQTYMNAAVAAGFSKSKIVATTLATTGQGAGGTTRDDVNTWLRANYTTYAGYLLDVAADPNLGVTGTTHNNASYYVDAAHMNASGDALYAALLRTTIGSLPW